MSSISPSPCSFSVIFFLYSLFSHPLLPQSESHLEAEILIRPSLHQTVHTSWVSSFPNFENRILRLVERIQTWLLKTQVSVLLLMFTASCGLPLPVSLSVLIFVLFHKMAQGTLQIMKVKSFQLWSTI